MYKKKWQDLKKIGDGFELEPETLDSAQCLTRINFTQATFHWNEEFLAAVDTAGYLYYIDLINRNPAYQKLGHVGPATFLAFNPTNKCELLIGLTTAGIKVLRINGNVSTICLLIAHKAPPTHISFYKEYCLTCSCKEVVIWCLKSCSKAKQLHVNTKDIVIKKASFSNLGHIIVLYYNNSFQVWQFNAMENDIKIDTKMFGLRNVKDYIFTQNGRAMIMAGDRNKLIVLNTSNWDLIKTINIPDSFGGVKRMSFVSSPLDGGANDLIACVSSNCTLYFFNINQACIIDSLYSFKPVRKVIVSPTGRYLAYIEKEGNLKLLETGKLFKEKNVEVQKEMKKICRPIAHCVSDHLKCVRQCMKQELRLERLLNILREFGEYPEEYRMLIWSTILKLPENKCAYNVLANRAAVTNYSTSVFKDYLSIYGSKKMILTTTLHCLTQWCPLLIQCTFLPNLIFPFLMVFQRNLLLGFEAILCILLNYCQKWFEYHPLPPLNVLGIIENIILQIDPVLLNAFAERGITSSEYAWPLLKTAMSEVLSDSEWLILWDHLISFKKPLLLLISVAAYSICSRELIISPLSNTENIRKYFTRQGHIGAKEIWKLAWQIDGKIPIRIHPSYYLRNELITLPSKGPYLSFIVDEFPKFLTSDIPPQELERLRDRERIIREENQRAIEISEKKRLKQEAKRYVDQVHETRLNEARRCFEEELSDVFWKLRTTEEQSEVFQSKLGSDSEGLHRVSNLDLQSLGEENNGDTRKSKHYEKLQRDVDRLELEVQSFLTSLRS